MSKNSKVFSPFAKDLEAVLKTQIDSTLIITEYRKFGLNVERYFDGIEKVGIFECPLTKYRFYYPSSIIADSLFYEELQNLQNDYYPKEKDEFTIALNNLKEGEKVLEVGCGNGMFLEKLKAKNIEGFGLEFNDLALEKCLAKGLNVQKISLSEFASENSEKFDSVVLFQVLEHIDNVSLFIHDLLQCLKKGGKLIFGVPDNSPFYKNFRIHLTLNLPPHHIGLWNAESFKNLEKIYNVTLDSINYDNDYSSIPNYVYFYGDLLLTKSTLIYKNTVLRNLFIVLLIPFTLPVILKMKFKSQLKPHGIVATFIKT